MPASIGTMNAPKRRATELAEGRLTRDGDCCVRRYAALDAIPLVNGDSDCLLVQPWFLEAPAEPFADPLALAADDAEERRGPKDERTAGRDRDDRPFIVGASDVGLAAVPLSEAGAGIKRGDGRIGAGRPAAFANFVAPRRLSVPGSEG
jgi:hypothetical protein